MYRSAILIYLFILCIKDNKSSLFSKIKFFLQENTFLPSQKHIFTKTYCPLPSLVHPLHPPPPPP